MIGRLTGILVEKNPPQILLDVQGVAYEVDVPMSTFYNLPGTGERPVAPVYEDGEKTVTLKGERIAEEFQELVERYVARRFPRRDAR